MRTKRTWVADVADVIPVETEKAINRLINTQERRDGTEIIVATVHSMDGESIKDFSRHVFNHIGIGKKSKDNGILILAALKERKVRIQVGYGLENSVTDSAATEIISSSIGPHFKQGDYGGGMLAGVKAVIGKINANIGSASATPVAIAHSSASGQRSASHSTVPVAPASGAPYSGGQPSGSTYPASYPTSHSSGGGGFVLGMVAFVFVAIAGFISLVWRRVGGAPGGYSSRTYTSHRGWNSFASSNSSFNSSSSSSSNFDSSSSGSSSSSSSSDSGSSSSVSDTGGGSSGSGGGDSSF